MKCIINERQFKLITETVENVISDIINYVKSFGQKGKLDPFNGRLYDCYKEALQTAYQWACENDSDLKRYGFRSFEHDFKVYVTNSFTLNKRGLIYVERSIDIDTSKGLGDLKFKSVGECWSWKKHNSRSYCADFSLLNNNVITVILCGYVHPNSVDWVETVYLNSYDMKNETEIRMNDNALVEVSYIKINGTKYRLNSSFLLNASSDKYNKDKWI